MVKLNRIYTRTGDDGTTGLVGGRRVAKNSLRVDAFGGIDELNAHIGLCLTLSTKSNRTTLCEKLTVIENQLFDVGAELATLPGDEWPSMEKMSEEIVGRLEVWIDTLNDPLPELRSFVLPGGTELNAQLHIARAVCRRVERCVLTLKEHEFVSESVVRYLNRLSDLLFVMSRFESHASGVEEILWIPGGLR